MIFYKLPAPIGAGKTTAIIEYCGYGAQAGEKFIVAQPSIDLVEQTYQAFAKEWPNTTAIALHSEVVDNVAVAIKEQTENCSTGMVIFCTHAGLIQAPFVAEKNEWHLIIDEMPQTVWTTRLRLTRNSELLSKVMCLEDAAEKYSRLVSIDDGTIDDMAKDATDGGIFSEPVHDLTRKMKSGWWDIRVLTDQWSKVMSKKKGDAELLVFGELSPQVFDGFETTTFVCANIERTTTYQHFVARGVEFKLHNRLIRRPSGTSRLRYTGHTNGHLLSIYYALDDRWSKKIRNQVVMDGQADIGSIIAAGAMEVFDDEPFAKLFNKDLVLKNEDPFDGHGEMLPHKSYGRNDFQYLHNAAIIPALNATPAFYSYLDTQVGLDPDNVRHAVYAEDVYQASGRISIRNLDDLTAKKIVVADKPTAEYIQSLYPGASLHKLPFSEFIPQKAPKLGGRPATRTEADKKLQLAEKDRRQYWKKKHSFPLQNYLIDKVVSCGKNPTTPVENLCGNQTQAGFSVSIWDSRAVHNRPYEDFEPQSHQHLIHQRFYTTEDFFAFLKTQAETKTYQQKHDNNLVCPSIFDLTKDPGKGHTKVNHVLSHGVMLDFDDGEITPEQIHTILPYEMAVYSSWSHTTDSLRFRVCIPTHPMTYDAQEAVRRMMLAKLTDAFPNKRHGLDNTKMTPVGLMYLPCRRPEGFFKIFQGEMLDHVSMVKACPKDIIDHIMKLSPLTEPEELPPPPPPRPTPDTHTTDDNQRIVNRAIQTWHERGLMKGNGRTQFWSLCRTLKEKTTLDLHDIKQIAWEQAGYAHNPQERRAEIDENLRK